MNKYNFKLTEQELAILSNIPLAYHLLIHSMEIQDIGTKERKEEISNHALKLTQLLGV